MTLATPEDFCLYHQRDVDTALALMLVEAASEAIESEIGYPVAQVVDDELTMPGTNRRKLVLPARPVTALAAAVLTDPDGDTETLDVNDDLVWHASGEVFRPHGFWWGGPTHKVTITYTHGLTAEQIPKWLKILCLQVAGRAQANPDGTVRQEAIGAYSVTYAGDAVGVELTAREKDVIARRWRRTSGTAHVTGL